MHDHLHELTELWIRAGFCFSMVNTVRLPCFRQSRSIVSKWAIRHTYNHWNPRTSRYEEQRRVYPVNVSNLAEATLRSRTIQASATIQIIDGHRDVFISAVAIDQDGNEHKL